MQNPIQCWYLWQILAQIKPLYGFDAGDALVYEIPEEMFVEDYKDGPDEILISLHLDGTAKVECYQSEKCDDGNIHHDKRWIHVPTSELTLEMVSVLCNSAWGYLPGEYYDYPYLGQMQVRVTVDGKEKRVSTVLEDYKELIEEVKGK